MDSREIADFKSRVIKRAETFELAGWPPRRAWRKALDYELSQLSALSVTTVEAINRALGGREDGA